jgi:aldehyde dehydrogenase (NAD+)
VTGVREAFESMAWGPAPESPSPALQWLEGHGRSLGHLIGGRFGPAGAATFPTMNPATGDELARVTEGTADDVDRSRQWAPICGASRPATSLVGASSGSAPSAVSTVS